jgi:hypothetical protein
MLSWDCYTWALLSLYLSDKESQRENDKQDRNMPSGFSSVLFRGRHYLS